jgi:hypothetical protein
MILVDTSVWIDHLARGDTQLQALLEAGEALTHPYVIGEIALGSLPRRQETLSALQALPSAPIATTEEAMGFLQRERLFGMGIGYVDLHLLASTRLQPAVLLWTRDKRLLRAAMQLNLAAFTTH